MLAVLMNLSTLEAKRAKFLTFLDLPLTRRPFHPIKNTPQLLQRNQPMIPQNNRQLRYRRLLLTGDEREGGFGETQVLLEVGNELGVVHETYGMTLLLRMPNTLAR